MQHFTVNMQELTKEQFEALKKAAFAAGLYLWTPDIASSLVCSEEWGNGHEKVTYPEALRRLADASEPPKLTPAQESGFEVGDLGVTGSGSILALESDEGGEFQCWRVVHANTSVVVNGCREMIAAKTLTKLRNVKEA